MRNLPPPPPIPRLCKRTGRDFSLKNLWEWDERKHSRSSHRSCTIGMRQGREGGTGKDLTVVPTAAAASSLFQFFWCKFHCFEGFFLGNRRVKVSPYPNSWIPIPIHFHMERICASQPGQQINSWRDAPVPLERIRIMLENFLCLHDSLMEGIWRWKEFGDGRNLEMEGI